MGRSSSHADSLTVFAYAAALNPSDANVGGHDAPFLLALAILAAFIAVIVRLYSSPPPKPPPPPAPARPAYVGTSAQEHEQRRQDAKFPGWMDGMNAWERDLWEKVWDKG